MDEALKVVRGSDEEHQRFRDWQDAFVNENGHPPEVVDAWQARAVLASAPAQHSHPTNRLSVGQSIELQPGKPDAFYTMDQMRDYAQSFHRSRMEHLRPRWVSVEERLPEFGHAVLIAFPDGGVDLSARIRFAKRWFWEGVSENYHEAPTHWMILPAAPAQNSDLSSVGKSETCDASSVASKEEPNP